MGAVRGVRKMVDRFMRPFTPTTTPSGGEFGWTLKDTSAAGAPTAVVVSGEGLVVTLAATSEAEVVTLYQNDVLMFLLNMLRKIHFTVKVSGFDAVTTLVFGVGSAQNDTADSIAKNAWFRVEGSASTSAVVAETDDAVNDNDDKATGKTLGSTLKKFTIDFSEGLSKVRFYADGDPVATAQTFDMSGAGATDKVQLFLQLQKASGTGTPAVTIREVEVEYAYSDG